MAVYLILVYVFNKIPAGFLGEIDNQIYMEIQRAQYSQDKVEVKRNEVMTHISEFQTLLLLNGILRCINVFRSFFEQASV